MLKVQKGVKKLKNSQKMLKVRENGVILPQKKRKVRVKSTKNGQKIISKIPKCELFGNI